MLKRTLYTIMGSLLGVVVTIHLLNKEFAKVNAYNLALTYYRSCTISVAYVVNRNKLTDEIRQEGYKNCATSSKIYHTILLKNL